MNEKEFHAGSILRVGESVYIKGFEGKWEAFYLEDDLTSSEMQEFFDSASPLTEKFEVLHKPDPVGVLEELPSGSIVAGGEHEVAIKFEKDWSLSGSGNWYSSGALLELLGNAIEVVRRGEAD